MIKHKHKYLLTYVKKKKKPRFHVYSDRGTYMCEKFSQVPGGSKYLILTKKKKKNHGWGEKISTYFGGSKLILWQFWGG